MIQIILLVQCCRVGTGTVQNKRINYWIVEVWPRYLSSLFQLIGNTKLWSSESFILYETLPYDYCFKLLIQSVLFLLYSFLLTFCFTPFSCQFFQLHSACCRHSLKKLSNDLGKGQYSSVSQLSHGKEF